MHIDYFLLLLILSKALGSPSCGQLGLISVLVRVSEFELGLSVWTAWSPSKFTRTPCRLCADSKQIHTSKMR